VFGRGKSQQSEPAQAGTIGAGAPAAKPVGKGRPTPTRREAEARNKRPLVGPALPANASKEQRKAARRAAREQLNAERALQRQALITGDDRHLPPRDKGPARRWTRDYVDARRSVGEYFLPVALVVLGMSLIRIPIFQLASLIALYGMLLLVIVDSFLAARRIKRETFARFGDQAQGCSRYGVMRMLQLRRTRMPRPQVPRGQFPT